MRSRLEILKFGSSKCTDAAINKVEKDKKIKDFESNVAKIKCHVSLEKYKEFVYFWDNTSLKKW